MQRRLRLRSVYREMPICLLELARARRLPKLLRQFIRCLLVDQGRHRRRRSFRESNRTREICWGTFQQDFCKWYWCIHLWRLQTRICCGRARSDRGKIPHGIASHHIGWVLAVRRRLGHSSLHLRQIQGSEESARLEPHGISRCHGAVPRDAIPSRPNRIRSLMQGCRRVPALFPALFFRLDGCYGFRPDEDIRLPRCVETRIYLFVGYCIFRPPPFPSLLSRRSAWDTVRRNFFTTPIWLRKCIYVFRAVDIQLLFQGEKRKKSVHVFVPTLHPFFPSLWFSLQLGGIAPCKILKVRSSDEVCSLGAVRSLSWQPRPSWIQPEVSGLDMVSALEIKWCNLQICDENFNAI